MTPFRDTYWNIPAWALIVLYTTQALALGVLAVRLARRARLWLQGEGRLPLDRIGARCWRVVTYAVAQLRLARESYAGVMHLSLFLAFVVLFIGTLLATVDYDIWHLIFDAKLLQGEFYLVYELALDFFTVAGIVGLALALGRRLLTRPAKLTLDFGFQAMLWILLLDLLTGLGIESLRLAAVQPEWRFWSFAGYGVSRLIQLLNPTESALRAAHLTTWLAHSGITALIYVVFLDLPLRHILTSPLNVFFSSFRHPGALRPLDLDDESVEAFGAAAITHFSPTQLLDADACTECGRCQVACPAWMAGTALNPKQVILDLRRGLDRYGPQMISGAAQPDDLRVTGTLVSEAALWACTTCRACVEECPVLIEHVDSIVEMRRHLTLMEGRVPDLLAGAMTNAERAGNPWANPRGTRLDWAKGLDVPVMAEKKKADVLYWVGCAGSYDPESQRTARAMIRILRAAGIDFAVLGEEERCHCEWARRAGNEYLYQEAAHAIIATFDRYEFHTLVTHCPHCFNTFLNEYPQFGGQYDVAHHSQYIIGLIRGGHLKLTRPAADLLTYHDSCYLGRYNGVYDAPREALRAAGVEIVEMARRRQKGLCCGGGGAQVWFEAEGVVHPVQELRLEEALNTGAGTVGTACPFCTIMLTSAAQSRGVTDRVAIKDFAVIVAEALG